MWKTLLALSVGLYLLLSALYWQAVPTGESPDEPGHLQCVGQVAQYGRVPVIEPQPSGEWWKPGVILSGRMCYHMPLYYLVAGQLQKGVAWVTGTPVPFEFPAHNADFGKTGIMFQHAPRTHFGQTNEPPTLAITRLLSVLLGLLTLYAAYQVTALVFPDRPGAPVLATALVAGWPQFVYLSRSISNDVLATAFAATLLVVLLRVGSPGRFPLAALLSAGAIASKLLMVFTVGVVLIAWAMEFWNFTEQRRLYLRALLLSAIVWAVALGALLLNPTVYQHLVGSGRYWSQQAGQTLSVSYWADVLALLLDSGWARFAWMNITVPEWQARFWWGFIVITGVIGFVLAWRASKERADKIRLMMLLVWMAGIAVSIVRINLVVFQPQFRFALASLPLFAAFAAGGILSMLPKDRRLQWAAVTATLVFLLAANLWIITAVLVPVYG